MPGELQRPRPALPDQIAAPDLDPVEANFVHEIKITNWLRMPDVCTLQVGYPPSHDGGPPFQSLDESKLEIGE